MSSDSGLGSARGRAVLLAEEPEAIRLFVERRSGVDPAGGIVTGSLRADDVVHTLRERLGSIVERAD